MFVKHLISFTEMGHILIPGVTDPVLGAAAMAILQPLTIEAGFWQVFLEFAEFVLFFGIEHFQEIILHNITQFPFRFHEEVAGINIAIMFYDSVNAAFFMQRTFRRFHAHILVKHRVKETNGNSRMPILKIGFPEIKDFA